MTSTRHPSYPKQTETRSLKTSGRAKQHPAPAIAASPPATLPVSSIQPSTKASETTTTYVYLPSLLSFTNDEGNQSE